MDDNATIYFARDLKLEQHEFRVTWSCGWFLHQLVHCQKLVFPSQALKAFTKVQDQIDEVVQGMNQHTSSPMGWLRDYIKHEESRFTVGVRDAPAWAQSARRALVLDCGTGESKVLLYEFTVESKVVAMAQLGCIAAAKDNLDEPHKFVQKVQAYFQQNKLDMTLVAASHWMRGADDEGCRKGAALLHQCIDKGMTCKVLDPRFEAWMETVAVEYASIKLDLKLTGSWASGSGSTQLSWEFRDVKSVSLGLKDGVEMIQKLWEEHGLKHAANQWRKEARDRAKKFQCKLQGRILGTSAAFFAAEDAGLATKQFVPASEVRQRFKAKIEELEAIVRKLSDKDLRALSNLIVQNSCPPMP